MNFHDDKVLNTEKQVLIFFIWKKKKKKEKKQEKKQEKNKRKCLIRPKTTKSKWIGLFG